LRAALAVLFKGRFGNTGNAETTIFTVLEAIVDLVSETRDLACQCIPVDLAQLFAPLVDARSLERLPASLFAIIGEISRDQVSVQLWIEFTAGVVIVAGDE
jgi:hypothetical protein